MFGQKFYNGVIRKYVIYFGTLFNDLEIDRVDSAGTVQQTLRVPISYGPRQKFIERLDVDANLDRKVALQLPRMSFEMTAFQYDAERRLSPTKKIYQAKTDDTNNLLSTYTPTPFDIGFQLAIMVKNAEDGVRILEQILPFFTPEFTATLKLIDNMDFVLDVPVIFQGLNTEDSYEADYTTRRVLIHTLDFVVKGFVFGNVKDQKRLIRSANTQFHVDPGATGVFKLDATSVASKVVVKPGLDANGVATSNSSVSINTNSINANDSFGYITEKTFNG